MRLGRLLRCRPLRSPSSSARPLAVVTGASTGTSYELACVCAENGYDFAAAANEARIHEAASRFRDLGAEVFAVDADLATAEGVDRLLAATRDRPIAALLANAGQGPGGSFLDQDFDRVRAIVDTNVTGTLSSSKWSAATCARLDRAGS